ncbi:MAG: AI-2E family transporter [Spirochaetales bacterium]|uniref:AI-2E family transporter n=1 Tax=Bullifex sp. TaxID=2815808 RepID=UPI002A5695DC|nr:AI-2E family transporter [Bullifex sp.]MDD7271049.1 AI-2E family transporter [Spirochaetales bacterium]MDY4067474.1 AI-2E family transporter [Bullifex sp.]
MKEEASNNYLRQIRTILFLGIIILFLFVLKATSEVMIPVAFALFIFAFVNPIMEKLSKLKIPSGLSIVFIMVFVIAIFLILGYLIGILVNLLIAKLPYYAERVKAVDTLLSQYIIDYVDDIPKDFSIIGSLNVDWYSFLMGWLTSISSRVLSLLSDVMIILITLMFLLFERSTFMPKISFALDKEKGQKLSSLLGKINKQISKYLALKTIISLLTGICFYLTALVTGLDFALLWGFLAFVLNYIPTIGSIIATGLTIFMAVIQFTPNWIMIVYVAVLTISIEMVLGNIIDPRIQGVQLNISPLMILISLSFWGYIWGIAGMFLAVPVMSIIQIICLMVPSLKPVAIILSSGKSYVREYKEKESMKKSINRRRAKHKEEQQPQRLDDIILPVDLNNNDNKEKNNGR